MYLYIHIYIYIYTHTYVYIACLHHKDVKAIDQKTPTIIQQVFFSPNTLTTMAGSMFILFRNSKSILHLVLEPSFMLCCLVIFSLRNYLALLYNGIWCYVDHRTKIWFLYYDSLSFSLSLSLSLSHTHTHTYIYIYIC